MEATEFTHTFDLEKGLRPPLNALPPSPPEDNGKRAFRHSEPIKLNQISPLKQQQFLFTVLILLVGMAACIAFLVVGIENAQADKSTLFHQNTDTIVQSVKASWSDYELFGLWAQGSCTNVPGKVEMVTTQNISYERHFCSRQEFRKTYDYIVSAGLDVRYLLFIPNITDEMRPGLEAETKFYLQENFPGLGYTGIKLTQPISNGTLVLGTQPKEPFYFPAHYREPQTTTGLEFLDIDFYSNKVRREQIEYALSTWQPALTERLVLAGNGNYGVILFHPGTSLSTANTSVRSISISGVVIRIQAVLIRAVKELGTSDQTEKSVFLYDQTDRDNSNESPIYLGGINVIKASTGETVVEQSTERSYRDVHSHHQKRFFEKRIQVANRELSVIVTTQVSEYKPNIQFVLLGAITIAVSSLILSICFYTHIGRIGKMNKIRSEAKETMYQAAKAQAQRERYLNDFIAHEVRNPLTCAIVALNFVKTTVIGPSGDDSKKKAMLEDLGVVDASLHYINDLLRNMLDMSRASSKQMTTDIRPTDILRDVLQPAAAILHLRGAKVRVDVNCPDALDVMSDKLKLKQIILNLAVNASKFVERGFIRLSAHVVDNKILLYVEDSGPGIPAEKRSQLFVPFQESLDLLNQGTGIGLSICKHLLDLIGGEIWLDESFHSGIEGYPGTRFVVALHQPPVSIDSDDLAFQDEAKTRRTIQVPFEARSSKNVSPIQLPQYMKVLFVDDNAILRKLFRRSINQIAPDWEIEVAANGESTLLIVEAQHFDIIFLDQYMASVDKQLLGTETVRALRGNGVDSLICGLSANDVGDQFQEAGADAFVLKPFPCEREALIEELSRVLLSRKNV